MSTVKLNCTNCNIEFEKNKHEISRRKAKVRCTDTNWFCSRTCAVSYSNKHRSSFTPPPPQHGNLYNKKWEDSISWYIKRMFSDCRKQYRPVESKQQLHDHLIEIWNGNCAVTSQPITRRDHKGNIDNNNPFAIASVDRIDSNKPYAIGNVRWTSLALNLAKSNLNSNEFDQYVHQFLKR